MLMRLPKSPSKQAVIQAGFVSIVVSLIIGVVLSLITIGFAQLMRREQKDALERQLSTQAFYAAESGVNDAALELKVNPNSTKYQVSTCPTTPVLINEKGPVEVSCVLVNSEPFELRFDGVPTDASKSKVIPINTTVKPDTITIQWVGTSGSSFRGSGSDFPQATSWSEDTGMIKLTLVSFQSGSRENLLESTAIAYLNPLAGGGAATALDYDSAKGLDGQGKVVNASCDNASLCRVTVGNIPNSPANEYYLIMSSLYKPNNVTISAKDTSNKPLSLKGVQTVIDSTGRTNDVLRRIQVRKPIRDDYLYAGGALDTPGSICKLIVTSPEETSDACGL